MKTLLHVLGFLLLTHGLIDAKNNPVYSGDIHFTEAEYVNEYTTRVPFQVVDHLIFVQARVFGKKGNFIIDTGSEKLLLNSVHFKLHKNDITSTASSVSGILDDIGNKAIDSLMIAGFSVMDRNADVLDLSHIEKGKNIQLLGVIGYEILKEYEVFIDFYLKQITLSKINKNGNRLDTRTFLETIRDSVDFTLKKHTIVLDCYVNHVPLKFGLDTGAEINMIHRSIPQEALKNFRIIRRLKLTGIKNRKKEVLAGKLYKVKLNDRIYCGVMRTILTNLNGMQSVYGTKLDGVLGYEFIAMKRLIINYRKQKIYFVKLPFTNKR